MNTYLFYTYLFIDVALINKNVPFCPICIDQHKAVKTECLRKSFKPYDQSKCSLRTHNHFAHISQSLLPRFKKNTYTLNVSKRPATNTNNVWLNLASYGSLKNVADFTHKKNISLKDNIAYVQ